jgi:hypothetical protein
MFCIDNIPVAGIRFYVAEFGPDKLECLYTILPVLCIVNSCQEIRPTICCEGSSTHQTQVLTFQPFRSQMESQEIQPFQRTRIMSLPRRDLSLVEYDRLESRVYSLLDVF